jgi:hypothetical protein
MVLRRADLRPRQAAGRGALRLPAIKPVKSGQIFMKKVLALFFRFCILLIYDHQESHCGQASRRF